MSHNITEGQMVSTAHSRNTIYENEIDGPALTPADLMGISHLSPYSSAEYAVVKVLDAEQKR